MVRSKLLKSAASLRLAEHNSHCSCPSEQLWKETWTRVWDGDGGAEAESEKRELTLSKAQQLEGSVVKVK